MIKSDTNSRLVRAVVVSNKMDKTAVARASRKEPHKLYKKYVKRSTTYYLHDEENRCRVGDVILMRQTRPRSATKRWELVEILDTLGDEA